MYCRHDVLRVAEVISHLHVCLGFVSKSHKNHPVPLAAGLFVGAGFVCFMLMTTNICNLQSVAVTMAVIKQSFRGFVPR